MVRLLKKKKKNPCEVQNRFKTFFFCWITRVFMDIMPKNKVKRKELLRIGSMAKSSTADSQSALRTSIMARLMCRETWSSLHTQYTSLHIQNHPCRTNCVMKDSFVRLKQKAHLLRIKLSIKRSCTLQSMSCVQCFKTDYDNVTVHSGQNCLSKPITDIKRVKPITDIKHAYIVPANSIIIDMFLSSEAASIIWLNTKSFPAERLTERALTEVL